MTKQFYFEGQWLDEDEYRFMKAPPSQLSCRSDLTSPYINPPDTMEPTQHMADGKYYTSKSRFRAETRGHGCVEVGNDPNRLKPRKKDEPDRESIRQSIKKAREIVASRT